MKLNSLLIIAACSGLIGCAATVPKELVSARASYSRANAGIASELAPKELHAAQQALAQAEESFEENQDSYQTRDLAYIAQRKSETAEATASIALEKKNQAQAKADYREAQGRIIKEAKQDLSQTRMALTESEHASEMAAQKLSAEQAARAAADQRAAEAQAALAKLGVVKEEARGLVITLSGSVLFESNRTFLLPQARARLDQVADALLEIRDRNLIIEGHADSQGSDSFNLDLSQRRADTVRDYLVRRGYQASRVQSRGIGEREPVANNASAEGRANNRRVEIIVERESHASN